MGGEPEARELKALRGLLGGGGLEGLNREFTEAIRDGDFDPGAPGHNAARKHLWQTALERVRESNPRALEGIEQASQ